MATWDRVTDGLARLAEEGRFTGTVLVVQSGQTLVEFCSGLADRASATPIGPGTRFALASLSKAFTSAAVLTCVRDGLIGVQDRVAAVLPASRRPRTMPAGVTVHHLLTHTSGIGDYAPEDEDLPG